MLTPDQFLAFLAAAILLTLSPGPDNMMVLSVGVSKGRARGIAFGLGCAFGCLSHTLLAVVGVISAEHPADFGGVATSVSRAQSCRTAVITLPATPMALPWPS